MFIMAPLGPMVLNHNLTQVMSLCSTMFLSGTQGIFRGCAKKQKVQKSEITIEVGGWAQASLGFFLENHPKTPLYQSIFWSSIPYVFCLYTLLKVVSYYDLSVLSMSVMGFQKNFGWEGWWMSTIQVFFLIFGIFFNFAKPLSSEPWQSMNPIYHKT